jgi:23S rRNA (pseudouridine1915-N3)-methyltransferase
MQIVLAYIGPKAAARDPFDQLAAMYLERCAPFARSEQQSFRTQEAMFEWIGKHQKRAPVVTVLLDSRGKQMSSEGFAEWVRRQRETATQQIVFAIGPADGWSDTSRKSATLLLSLGPFTLAHALARVVLAEQVYRAFTILTGHPYHAGH